MNRGGFSWKRLVGISAAKSKLSRAIGVPLTRSGRQRKLGRAMGCATFVALLVGLVVVVACVATGDPSPSASGVAMYCSTANPLGLTYQNALGENRRLFKGVVLSMRCGPDGLMAALQDNDIRIFRYGKPLRTKRKLADSVDLVGWSGIDLLYRNDGVLFSLDSRSGNALRSVLTPAPDAVLSLQAGFVGVSSGSSGVVVTHYSRDGREVRRWRMSGWSGANPSHALVGGKYYVVEVLPEDKGTVLTSGSCHLWIIDLTTGSEQTLRLDTYNYGFCEGRSEGELLLGLTTTEANSSGAEVTRLVAVDLKSLHQEPVLQIKGSFNLIGLSPDKRWLIGLSPYAVVGPGKVVAVAVADGKVRTLQENVYECALAD